MLGDLEMPWKPFGLTLTFGEWDELVTWYIQKSISENLDKKEDNSHAEQLYSQKLDSWTN
jgi:hypothetical protein